MIQPQPSRRRVLRVLAAGAAAAALAPSAFAEAPLTHWRGYALGAEAALTIRDSDRRRAAAVLQACVAEIARIEEVFSLHRRTSALVQLNDAGVLAEPPPELVEVLSYAAQVSELSEGAFDVTVQPLWNLYTAAQRDPRRLAAAVEEVRTRIGWRRLKCSIDRIAFQSPGMAATLNGIAQGYATDRIADLLRRHGFRHVLVNLGEFRGLGEREPGRPWRVGIGLPDGAGLADVMELSGGAVATSSPYGTAWDMTANRHHLFDPRTGRSARSWSSVSVIAGTAMQADALSTAIAVAPEAAADAILSAGGCRAAVLIDGKGQMIRRRI